MTPRDDTLTFYQGIHVFISTFMVKWLVLLATKQSDQWLIWICILLEYV